MQHPRLHREEYCHERLTIWFSLLFEAIVGKFGYPACEEIGKYVLWEIVPWSGVLDGNLSPY